MGLELLMHVIQSINPDAVFQLRKSEDKPSKEVLDSHYANNFTFRHPPLNKVGTDVPCVLFIVFTVILLHIYPSLAPSTLSLQYYTLNANILPTKITPIATSISSPR